MIQEATVFRTEDGKTFDTREHAEAYVVKLEIEGRINAYVEQLEGSDKAKVMMQIFSDFRSRPCALGCLLMAV